MARTHDRTTSWLLSSDADFRTWASAIHNAIVNAGLVQTADTGQINFGTVLRPAAADTLAGYAIYRFADAEQATNPIFLRVDYYSGDAITQGRLWFQVGKGSNGAGTLTNASAQLTSSSADATDSANRVIHCGHVDGSFCLAATADFSVSGGNFFCLIDREMDAAGAYTGRIYFGGSSGTSVTSQVWTGGSWTASVTLHYATPGLNDDPAGNTPITTMWPNGWRAPIRSMMCGVDAEFGSEDRGTIEIDGVARDYMALANNNVWTGGATNGPTSFFVGSSATVKTLLLDE